MHERRTLSSPCKDARITVSSGGEGEETSEEEARGGGEGGAPWAGGTVPGSAEDGDVPGGRLPATSDLVITTKMGSWD